MERLSELLRALTLDRTTVRGLLRRGRRGGQVTSSGVSQVVERLRVRTTLGVRAGVLLRGGAGVSGLSGQTVSGCMGDRSRMRLSGCGSILSLIEGEGLATLIADRTLIGSIQGAGLVISIRRRKVTSLSVGLTTM